MARPRERPAFPLPCPGVRFAPDFGARLERASARVRAAFARAEGAQGTRAAGPGFEFESYRAYAPGDDLRAFDWNLYARGERPSVRVARREAGESWAVIVDASASMGIGPPGKLQHAAECAAALATSAVILRARSEVLVLGATTERFELARASRAPELLSFLEARTADAALDPLDWSAAVRAAAGHERVVLLSDLAGVAVEPLLEARERGSRWTLVQILASSELVAPSTGAFAWHEPESGAELELMLDESLARAYALELEHWRRALERTCEARGARFVQTSSADLFEDSLRRILA